MGIRKKWVPGCGCCGVVPCDDCDQYKASDGNQQTDDFSGDASGWQENDDEYFSIAVVSGRLIFTEHTAAPPDTICYAANAVANPTQNGICVVVEATIYQLTNSATTGIYFGIDEATPIFKFAFFARWAFTSYGARVNGVFRTFGSGQASGQRLTMRLYGLSSTSIRACFFVDGSPVYSEDVSMSLSAYAESYGMMCSPSGGTIPRDIGSWDDFSIHVGNP